MEKTAAKAPETTAKTQKATQAAATYTAGELSLKARTLFGASPELVAVALSQAGKPNATVAQAKAIVDKFLKKEVK